MHLNKSAPKLFHIEVIKHQPVKEPQKAQGCVSSRQQRHTPFEAAKEVQAKHSFPAKALKTVPFSIFKLIFGD